MNNAPPLNKAPPKLPLYIFKFGMHHTREREGEKMRKILSRKCNNADMHESRNRNKWKLLSALNRAA